LSAGAGPTATPSPRPDAFNQGVAAAVRNEQPPPDNEPGYPPDRSAVAPDRLWRRALRTPRVLLGGGILLLVILACFLTLPWTLSLVEDNRLGYDHANPGASNFPPFTLPADSEAAPDGDIHAGYSFWRSFGGAIAEPGRWAAAFGYDLQARGVLGRCLLGGIVSLSVGLAAAAISVLLGVGVGLLAGYRGGKTDAALMRFVDVMYGLPYILLVIMFQVALRGPLEAVFEWLNIFPSDSSAANLTVMFLAIGLVSWLTMARVVRGQVLSLRGQPFVEAARAAGISPTGIFFRHLLPNLVGPILVYATLTVPQAILQESFLSFLGIGVQPPLPSWGGLAAEGLRPAMGTFKSYWWQLLFPCLLLAVTLLSLNFLGDGLRDLFDPKREGAKL
jgi:oligopeptide transport system permease protein